VSPRSPPPPRGTARNSEDSRSEESRTHAARSARVCASAASLLIAREESDFAHRAPPRTSPRRPFSSFRSIAETSVQYTRIHYCRSTRAYSTPHERERGYLKMADASSSDTTSDCCNECFSDITSEKSEYVVVGRKPCTSHRRSKRNLLQKLLIREVSHLDSRDSSGIVSDRPQGTAPHAVKNDFSPMTILKESGIIRLTSLI